MKTDPRFLIVLLCLAVGIIVAREFPILREEKIAPVEIRGGDILIAPPPPREIAIIKEPPAYAITYFVRTDGAASPTCNGQTNASSTSSPNCAFATVPQAVTAATCGDIIKAQAGQSWDTATPYNLPNKSCTAGTPITITTTASLPSARVTQALATSMPRFRTTSGNPVFQTAVNAGHWILDGLEITDNTTSNDVVNYLVDFANSTVNNITVQRCYIHPKEIDTLDYTRNAVRATSFEGSGFTFKWNYAAGFLGRQPDGQLPTTQIVLCISCNNVTLLDNYMQAWYTPFFTGGGGSSPQFTATLSGATTASATFSSVTGLSNGILVRMNLTGTATSNGVLTPYNDVVGTFDSTVMTRTGGTALVDFNAAGSQQGYHVRLTPTGGGTTYRGRLKAVSGTAMTVVWEYGQSAPAGTYNWVLWAVVRVSSVSGNVVQYVPYGPNRLLQSPTMPGEAAWRQSAVVHTWNVTRNTIDIPYDYSIHEHSTTGNSPKGWFELKDMDGMVFEGNLITGYPSALGLSNRSNEGGTPWSTLKNLSFFSNFFNATPVPLSAVRQFMIAQTDDYSNSATPGENITISNNLVKAVNVIAQTDAMVNATITHNTFINDSANSTGNSVLFGLSASAGTVLTDNIVANNGNGLNCQSPPHTQATCWPGGVFNHNVVVDNMGAGVNVNSWGPNSILSPIRTSFAQVGFVDTTANNYQLSPASAFKGAGNAGTDPGVAWPTLVTALGFDPAGGSAVTGVANVSGKVTISGKVRIGP